MQKISDIITKNLFKEEEDRKTERGELLRFFVENLKTPKGKKYSFVVIGVKLSHIETKDLYYLISQCKDRLRRNGQETMQKYFWWAIKGKNGRQTKEK